MKFEELLIEINLQKQAKKKEKNIYYYYQRLLFDTRSRFLTQVFKRKPKADYRQIDYLKLLYTF